MERDRHVPRKNRLTARSVFLSLSPSSLFLSVSSVTQFVVSSRFYESNKLYLAARHGRWVMGVVGGDSLFLSLSRRKSTQDHGRTFSTNNTNPWQSRQRKYLTIWIKGTICLFSSGLIALERSVEARNDRTDGPLFWLELRRATCHGRIKRRFTLLSFAPSCVNSCVTAGQQDGL